jgi:hypothetical protein
MQEHLANCLLIQAVFSGNCAKEEEDLQINFGEVCFKLRSPF